MKQSLGMFMAAIVLAFLASTGAEAQPDAGTAPGDGQRGPAGQRGGSEQDGLRQPSGFDESPVGGDLPRLAENEAVQGEIEIIEHRAADARDSTDESRQQPGGEPFEMPQDGQPPPVEAEPIVSTPIESGFVIVDGRYIPPPYVVQQRGEDVFVNDHLVPGERRARPFSGFGPRPPGPGRWGWHAPGRPSFPFSRAEQQLRTDALLLVQQDGAAGFIAPGNALLVLDILLSDASSESRIQSLADGRFRRFNSTQWAGIVETFQQSPELAERIRRIKAENERLVEEASAARRRVAILHSAPMKYGVTVVAMVLAVIAIGSLLTRRPNNDARWTEIDQDGDGVAMVVWNVVLLALLNGFDLALTLVAQQAGGFLELNPLGNRLASNPVYLASFKITALLTACLILVLLRRYRGAQTASWWLCLVCTILAFRWLTYNSMFLT